MPGSTTRSQPVFGAGRDAHYKDRHRYNAEGERLAWHFTSPLLPASQPDVLCGCAPPPNVPWNSFQRLLLHFSPLLITKTAQAFLKKARTYRKVKAANSSDRTVFLYSESRFSSITYYNHILCKRKKVLKSVLLCGNLFFRLSVQLLGAGWGAQRAKRLQDDLTT